MIHAYTPEGRLLVVDDAVKEAKLTTASGHCLSLHDAESRVKLESTDGHFIEMVPSMPGGGGSHLSLEDGSAHMYHGDYHVLADGGQAKLCSAGAEVQVTSSEVSITAGGSNITVSGGSINVTSGTVNLNS